MLKSFIRKQVNKRLAGQSEITLEPRMPTRDENDGERITLTDRGTYRLHALEDVLSIERRSVEVQIATAELMLQAVGLERLLIKDESRLPTGSFKARGLCLAVSRAKELGLSRLAIPTMCRWKLQARSCRSATLR